MASLERVKLKGFPVIEEMEYDIGCPLSPNSKYLLHVFENGVREKEYFSLNTKEEVDAIVSEKTRSGIEFSVTEVEAPYDIFHVGVTGGFSENSELPDEVSRLASDLYYKLDSPGYLEVTIAKKGGDLRICRIY